MPLLGVLRNLPGVSDRPWPRNRPKKKSSEARPLRGSRQSRQGSVRHPRVASVAGWVPLRLGVQSLEVLLLRGRDRLLNLNLSLSLSLM